MEEDEDKWYLVLRELAKKNHQERVAKTPDRIEYAIKRFKNEGLKFTLKNSTIGHFHCFDKEGNLFQFWASTGKIYFDNKTRKARDFKFALERYMGIENCIKIIKGEKI